MRRVLVDFADEFGHLVPIAVESSIVEESDISRRLVVLRVLGQLLVSCAGRTFGLAYDHLSKQ